MVSIGIRTSRPAAINIVRAAGNGIPQAMPAYLPPIRVVNQVAAIRAVAVAGVCLIRKVAQPGVRQPVRRTSGMIRRRRSVSGITNRQRVPITDTIPAVGAHPATTLSVPLDVIMMIRDVRARATRRLQRIAPITATMLKGLRLVITPSARVDAVLTRKHARPVAILRRFVRITGTAVRTLVLTAPSTRAVTTRSVRAGAITIPKVVRQVVINQAVVADRAEVELVSIVRLTIPAYIRPVLRMLI